MGTRLGYRPQLDGLRGVAVLAVMVHHTGTFLIPSAEGWMLPGGFLGVDLFLVLSGFLITRLLLERHADGERTPGAFYMRRFRRLLPAVALLILATVVWTAFASPWRTRIAVFEALASMSYLANYLDVYGFLGHMWSLAIEEQFYVLWPPVLLVALNRRVALSRVAAGLAVAVAVVVVWRAAIFDPADVWATYKRTDARADALAIGCLLAVGWPHLSKVRWPAPVALAGYAACLGVVSVHWPALHLGGFTVVAALCAVLVAGAAAGTVRWAQARWLVTIGKWSYSLYLWHYLVFNAVGDRGAVWSAAAWALTLGFSYVSWRWVEQRFRSGDREPILARDVGLDAVPVG